MAQDQTGPIDAVKLTTLLNELEQETTTRPMPATTAIGAVRRAVWHGRLNADTAQ